VIPPARTQTPTQLRFDSLESPSNGHSTEAMTTHERIRSAEWPKNLQRTEHRPVIGDLDPDQDYERILRLTTFQDLPWEVRCGHIIALAELGIAQDVLTHTELAQLLATGLASPENTVILGRLRRGVAALPSDDAVSLLLALATSPVNFAATYGWRDFIDAETAATACWYRDLGQRIGVTLPARYADIACLSATRFGSTEHIPAAAHQHVIADLVNRAAGKLPPRLRASVGMTVPPVAGAAASLLHLLEHTPARTALRYAYREAALTRRQLILLSPGRQNAVPFDQ
jgi:hypothetical protein